MPAEPIITMTPSKALELLEIELRTETWKCLKKYKMPNRTRIQVGSLLGFVNIVVANTSTEFKVCLSGCSGSDAVVWNKSQLHRVIQQDVYSVQDLLTVSGNLALAMHTEYEEIQRLLMSVPDVEMRA